MTRDGRETDEPDREPGPISRALIWLTAILLITALWLCDLWERLTGHGKENRR